MIAWSVEDLVARDGTRAEVQRGAIEGGLGKLALARLECPRSDAPTVIFLSGGPGDPGTQWLAHGPFLKVFQQIQHDRHVVLVDQRGSGGSAPDLSVPPLPTRPETFATEGYLRADLLAHLGRSLERAMESGFDPRSMTAVESARDIVAVIDGLELERAAIWGYSYGTHLAQMIGKIAPARVERVLLCGFESPDQTFKFPGAFDSQIVRFDEFVPGFAADVAEAIGTLYEEPVEVNGTAFGGFALQVMIANWIGISNRWARLPRIVQELQDRRTTALAESWKDWMRLWSRSLTFYLTDAASGAAPSRWRRILSEAPTALLDNAMNFPFPEVGHALGAGDIGEAGRSRWATDAPVAIFTGGLDCFTPTANATEGMLSLGNAVHREIAYASHADLVSCPAAVDAMAAFLRGEDVKTGPFSMEPPRLR